MTVVGACLALVRYVPWVGVAAMVLCGPAVIFAMIVGAAYRRDKRPLTLSDRMELLILSVLVSATAFLGGLTVFFGIFIVGGLAGMLTFETPCLIVAGIAGLAVFCLIFWRFVRFVRSG